MADLSYTTKVYEKQGGDELVVADGGIINIETGGKLQNNGVDMDLSAGIATSTASTTAELDTLHDVVAGTSSASKAAVLGTDKNLDVLALPVGGLKIGAGAGVAVTPSAAELNVLTGVTVGTASASKAAVLDVNKDLDAAALRTRILGAGNNYKIARGVHQQVAAADTVATGLTTVVAVVVSPIAAPTAKQAFVTATVGNQSGAPVAGSIIINTWKSTYVAADDFGDNLSFAWIAVGT